MSSPSSGFTGRKGPEDILTDYMGLPLTKVQVRALLIKAQKHLEKDPEELAAYGNSVLKKKYPAMALKIELDAARFK